MRQQETNRRTDTRSVWDTTQWGFILGQPLSALSVDLPCYSYTHTHTHTDLHVAHPSACVANCSTTYGLNCSEDVPMQHRATTVEHLNSLSSHNQAADRTAATTTTFQMDCRHFPHSPHQAMLHGTVGQLLVDLSEPNGPIFTVQSNRTLDCLDPCRWHR